jgi:hypothetical protein
MRWFLGSSEDEMKKLKQKPSSCGLMVASRKRSFRMLDSRLIGLKNFSR